MRNTFARSFADKPDVRVTVQDGTFDTTGLPDGWADLVIVAQVRMLSFNYTSSEKNRHEALLLFINCASSLFTRWHSWYVEHWTDIECTRQAFHWCPDHEAAIKEFSRILKPNGVVILIWNLEDRWAFVFHILT